MLCVEEDGRWADLNGAASGGHQVLGLDLLHFLHLDCPDLL